MSETQLGEFAENVATVSGSADDLDPLHSISWVDAATCAESDDAIGS
jgi:hypothetical protein